MTDPSLIFLNNARAGSDVSTSSRRQMDRDQLWQSIADMSLAVLWHYGFKVRMKMSHRVILSFIKKM